MGYWNNWAEFSELKGKVFASVTADGSTVTFLLEDGSGYRLYHEQECCECVYVESVVGDLQDLVGEEILMAEEVSNADLPPPDGYGDDSNRWTFYKLATRKGYVDIRFFGSSSGYSTGVDLIKLEGVDD